MPLNQAAIETTEDPATPEMQNPATSNLGDSGQQESKLPDVVLRDPAIRMTLEQKIPGVIVPAGTRYPKAEAVAEHAEAIVENLGLLFYQSRAGDVALYNPALVSSDLLAKADEQGKLFDVLPEYGKLTGEVPSEGEGQPAAIGAGLIPPTPRGASNPEMPKPSAGSKTKQTQARLKNLVPEAPVGGSSVLAGLENRAI